MPATIKESEITLLRQDIPIHLDVFGLEVAHATIIMRRVATAESFEINRPDRCVYVARLGGGVAIEYPRHLSPVIYIGDGNSSDRVSAPVDLLAPFAVRMPHFLIEADIAQINPAKDPTLYRSVVTDLLAWFNEEYGTLPWFNQHLTPGTAGGCAYEEGARKTLRRHIGIGAGTSYTQTIRPTLNKG